MIKKSNFITKNKLKCAVKKTIIITEYMSAKSVFCIAMSIWEGRQLTEHIKTKRKRNAISMHNGLRDGKMWFAYLFLLPAMFNFALFWCVPNVDSIFMSFTDRAGAFTWDNYVYVLEEFSSTGGILFEAVRNTLIYFCFGYFITQTMNVLLAYFFYKKIRGTKFFRFLFYVPNMLATIIMTTLYTTIMSPEGPVIALLYKWGWISEKYALLQDSRFAMAVSLGYSLWTYVGAVLLWASGAMARVPKELLEAASLDGISWWGEIIYIILPMISGTLSTLYIIGIGGILTASGATMYLTFGEYGTMTLSFWIFRDVYQGGGGGTSSALGLLMTLVTTPLIFFVKWLAGKVVPEVEY